MWRRLIDRCGKALFNRQEMVNRAEAAWLIISNSVISRMDRPDTPFQRVWTMPTMIGAWRRSPGSRTSLTITKLSCRAHKTIAISGMQASALCGPKMLMVIGLNHLTSLPGEDLMWREGLGNVVGLFLTIQPASQA